MHQKRHLGIKLKIFALILGLEIFPQVRVQAQTIDFVAENDSTFTIELGDVVVTATRNVQRLSKGGLITDIKGTPLSDHGTCRDVIYQLPGGISNEGNLEVVGRGTPQIYINGRKLIDKSELDRLSSKEIQNVEIIFNPGSKYGAETKAVILIKTIKKQGDGLSGSLSVTGRQAHYFSQSDNLFLNYRNGGLDIFGTFNYDFARRYQEQRSQTTIKTSSDCYLINSNILIYPKTNSYLTNIGANWQINRLHYIGVKYENTATPDSKSRWLTDERVMRSNEVEDKIFYETNWRRSTVAAHLVNMYYQGKVNAFNITINNDYYSRRNHNRQSIAENSLLGGECVIGSDNRVRNSMFASKGVVNIHLMATRLSLDMK